MIECILLATILGLVVRLYQVHRRHKEIRDNLSARIAFLRFRLFDICEPDLYDQIYLEELEHIRYSQE